MLWITKPPPKASSENRPDSLSTTRRERSQAQQAAAALVAPAVRRPTSVAGDRQREQRHQAHAHHGVSGHADAVTVDPGSRGPVAGRRRAAPPASEPAAVANGPDQRVPGEDARAAAVGNDLRQGRLLDRQERADLVAAGADDARSVAAANRTRKTSARAKTSAGRHHQQRPDHAAFAAARSDRPAWSARARRSCRPPA